MRRVFTWGLVCLVLTAGCKKKAPVDVVDPNAMFPSVDDQLQLVMVSPSDVPAMTPTPAQVVGRGFSQGAEVRIGEDWVAGVSVDNENLITLTLPALPDGRYDLTVQNLDGSSRTLYAALGVGTAGTAGVSVATECTGVTVYFELDSNGLSSKATRTLDDQVTCWSDRGYPVRIDGHADERGTTDYNLALGQRRANAVRTHLSKSGIPLHQMRTVSYGEERPEDASSNETAWAANRRVEVSLD